MGIVATWLRLLLVVGIIGFPPTSAHASVDVIAHGADAPPDVSLLRVPARVSAVGTQRPEVIRAPTLMPRLSASWQRVAVRIAICRVPLATRPPSASAADTPSCRGPPA